ncbi:hypothetical protein ACI8AC_12675 [Geodermatophilus sp. SYSU D00758]
MTPDPGELERCLLPDAARGMGVFFCATRGTGKSRTLGRIMAWQDFNREEPIPLVVLDPVGGTIDNLLDKIGREPLTKRRQLWKRVRYVNMNGQDGRVIPWPIYYEARPGERFSARSERFVEIVRRADPALQTASIQGLNALAPLALAGGIVLSALGLGITELWSLIHTPQRWDGRLAAVETLHPETAAAIAELRALGQLNARDWASKAGSLRSKLSLFQFHPNFRAIFGAATPGINWQEVVAKRQAVLLDFRDIENAEVKKFCLLWVYQSFLTFIKQRGHNHMGSPVSFIIDELSYMVGNASLPGDPLAGDIDELVHRISRSHGIWVTLATQELFQLPEQIRRTVLSMGTVILGQTSDDQAAEELARRFYRYDPYLVKKSRTIYGPLPSPGKEFREPLSLPVGSQTTEFTKGEQNYLNSRIFLDLQRYHFLVGQSEREGELPTTLRHVTVEDIDAGEYPERSVTDSFRSQLMRRDGIPEQAILQEIDTRLQVPEPLAGAVPDTDTLAPPPPVSQPAQEPVRPATSPDTAALSVPEEPVLRLPEGLQPLRHPGRSRKPPRAVP